MANKYKISSKSLYSFINEGIYKLPRFQRKDTWRDQQYFELCLSIFQDYPIGSVIVNNDNKSLWLLDGRQRISRSSEAGNRRCILFSGQTGKTIRRDTPPASRRSSLPPAHYR